MDALASLAFGIIVVQVIRELGVDEPGAVARNTAKAGIFSCLFMGLIYVAVTAMSAKSRGVLPAAENGGVALAQISQTFLGRIGLLILAVTVTLACLKTAVGLITSCSETFTGLFPKGPAYRVWAVIFTLVSLIFANFGLSAIIDYAVPVLMFLYPLAIVLILLALFGNNVRASAVSILYGFIPFLYLTALALGTNALILGVFAAYYVNNGVSLLVYLAGILPHGIFELTALMLAFAGGFLLCRQITQYVRSNTKGMMKPLMLNLLRVFILHILPLLAVAAVAEVYVTPHVRALFM